MKEKIKYFFVTRKKPLIIAGAILVVLIGSATTFVLTRKKVSEPAVTETPKTEEPKPTVLPSLVNGVMVAADLANKRVVATMIENSPAARPQIGLTSADVVYEAVAEGGITRFLAIFQQTPPDKAGPVRSARSYYIDWLSEYDAMYVHAGGSPTALSRIGEYGIKDYPHSNDGTFWREAKAGVSSEHTLFANIAQIYANGVSKRNWSATHDFSPWKFVDPLPTPVATHGDISIDFSSASYKALWKFNATTNTYSRELAGVAHKDRTSGEQITASTIVAMVVERAANAPYSTGKESEWTMKTISEGKATVFKNGTVTEGTWKKPSRTERTRFYDTAGAEIELNRGKIWIEVVPPTGTYSASGL